MMRTTVNLGEDVYQAARSLAAAGGLSLGEALGELVRRGLRRPAVINTDKAFPCFEVPEDAEPITLEQTLRAEDEI